MEETEKDFLDEIIEESTAQCPEFPCLLAEAVQRRELMHDLVALRAEQGISQRAIARRLETSPAAIAHVEDGAPDVQLALIQRYAATLGKRIELRIVDA